MTPLIAPSILAADFTRLGDEVQAVMDAGADLIHFDVMDNHYVPNLSFGPMVLDALKKRFSDVEFDVHLMVSPVASLIEEFLKSGASYLSIHPESTDHLHAALLQIKHGGAQAGVVLNPGTPLHSIDSVIEDIDYLLMMSVNPGFGGQKFIENSVRKISEARAWLDERKLNVRLEVDGGINLDNIGRVRQAGADMFVAGSAIFGSPDYGSTIQQMRQAMAPRPHV